MKAVEREILRVSREYAEAAADCEELRSREPYPQPKWQAAWDRRLALMSEWMALSLTLTKRPTVPRD